MLSNKVSSKFTLALISKTHTRYILSIKIGDPSDGTKRILKVIKEVVEVFDSRNISDDQNIYENTSPFLLLWASSHRVSWAQCLQWGKWWDSPGEGCLLTALWCRDWRRETPARTNCHISAASGIFCSSPVTFCWCGETRPFSTVPRPLFYSCATWQILPCQSVSFGFHSCW